MGMGRARNYGCRISDEDVVIDTPAKRFLVHAEMPGFEPRRFEPKSE